MPQDLTQVELRLQSPRSCHSHSHSPPTLLLHRPVPASQSKGPQYQMLPWEMPLRPHCTSLSRTSMNFHAIRKTISHCQLQYKTAHFLPSVQPAGFRHTYQIENAYPESRLAAGVESVFSSSVDQNARGVGSHPGTWCISRANEAQMGTRRKH